MEQNPRDIIYQPIISEKTTREMATGKYSFWVDTRATKTEVKHAIESIFKVKVIDVNTLRLEGKVKRMGRSEGRRPERKKAVVTLRPGDKIAALEGLQ
ncbi:MAG: 50S ribosomal protein L23 [Bacillota bacterium]